MASLKPTTPKVVLVPLRDHRLLVSTASHNKNDGDDADILPYIPLVEQQQQPPEAETSSTTCLPSSCLPLGRVLLLQTMWKACGCASASRRPGTTTNKCPACLTNNAWVKRYVPRQLLLFKVTTAGLAGTARQMETSSSRHEQQYLLVQMWVSQQSVYPIHKCIRVLRKHQPATADTTDVAAYTLSQLVAPVVENENDKSSKNNSNTDTSTAQPTTKPSDDWFGPITLQPDDVLQLANPKQERDHNALEFRIVVLKASTTAPPVSAATVSMTDQQHRHEQRLDTKQHPVKAMGSSAWKKPPPPLDTRNAAPAIERRKKDSNENNFQLQELLMSSNTRTTSTLQGRTAAEKITTTSSPVLKSNDQLASWQSNNHRTESNSSSSVTRSSRECRDPNGANGMAQSIPPATTVEEGVDNTEDTRIMSNRREQKQEVAPKAATVTRKPCKTMPPNNKTTVPKTVAGQQLKPSMPHTAAVLAATAIVNDKWRAAVEQYQTTENGITDTVTNKADNSAVTENQPYILYFVRKGTDMTNALIDGSDGLKAHVIARGAQVIDVFDRSSTTATPLPTHLVCSNQVKPESIASALGFASMNELTDFLQQHDIKPVQRKWAARGNRILKPPMVPASIGDIYRGLRIKPSTTGGQGSRLQQEEASAAILVSQATPVANRNRALADLFKKLSKLYLSAPIDGADEWRAYSFMKVSGQLRYLEFEVTCHPSVLDDVRKTKQFGATTVEIIQQFLETGTCERLESFQRDPRRRAMQAMMGIWGVGRVRATELVKQGYETIAQVRSAVDGGTLTLDRNQYIGLLCYEDIQDEMSRDEADCIFSIVRRAVDDRYPSAQCTIMGSYRRGKETCGDVDIMITHPQYENEVPPNALGRIVDDLMSAGHISYHLTFISGMEHSRFESLPQHTAAKLTKLVSYGRNRNKRAKVSSSSYMGVFHSPVVQGKHRRVDIKFYPYRERVFAGLYFTGNGYFNRAMRLWAKQKMFYHLDDHGLFRQGTSERVMEAQTEEEVFEKLGLEYKEVTERDGFAAVQSKNGGESALQLEMSRRDIDQEIHWVK